MQRVSEFLEKIKALLDLVLLLPTNGGIGNKNKSAVRLTSNRKSVLFPRGNLPNVTLKLPTFCLYGEGSFNCGLLIQYEVGLFLLRNWFSTSAASLTEQICINVRSNQETHVFEKGPCSNDVTSRDSSPHQTQLHHPYSLWVALYCASAPCDACVTTCVLHCQSGWGRVAYLFFS